MNINIWDAFEMLDEIERTTMPGTDMFEALRIDPSELGIINAPNSIDISHPRINNLITEYNNKVGSIMITYTLALHYFNKGIPDDPWYISPGTEGQSVQYMPLFMHEHWGRRYWFSYYADVYYLKIMSLWDSVLEILNHYYGYNLPVDMRLRSKLLDKLKSEHPRVFEIFSLILEDQLYQQAQTYRTAAAHGTSPSAVTNTVEFARDVECEVFDRVENGKVIMKTVRGTQVTHRVGDYTKVADIAKHMNDFAPYCATRIHDVLSAAKP